MDATFYGSWQSTKANADDSDVFFGENPPISVAAFLVSGSSATFVNPDGDRPYTLALKSYPAPLQANYTIRLGLTVDPLAMPVSGLLAARAVDMTGTPGQWANGITQTGMAFAFSGGSLQISSIVTTADGLVTSSLVWTDPTDYGGVVHAFDFQLQVLGEIRTFYVNEVAVYSDTLGGFETAGDAYIFLNLDTTSNNSAVLDNIDRSPFRFWTDFVKSSETDNGD